MTVQRGFYVHYKGGIYFVLCVAEDKDEGTDPVVVYESVQSSSEYTSRFRKLSEFTQLVDSRDGRPFLGEMPNIFAMPRFQRVLDWTPDSRPWVQGMLEGGRVPFGTFYKKESVDGKSR